LSRIILLFVVFLIQLWELKNKQKIPN
jgi:hypothetical protein